MTNFFIHSLLYIGEGDALNEFLVEKCKKEHWRNDDQHTADKLNNGLGWRSIGKGNGDRIPCEFFYVGNRLLYHIPAVKKGKEHGADDAAHIHRHHHPHNKLRQRGAVQLGGLDYGIRHGLKALCHNKCTEGCKYSRQQQCPVGIEETHLVKDDVIGDKSYLQGQNHYHHQGEEGNLSALEFTLGKAVAAHYRDHKLSRNDAQAKAHTAPETIEILRRSQEYIIVT